MEVTSKLLKSLGDYLCPWTSRSLLTKNSSLTAKLLLRLTSHFEKELERVHPEKNGVEVSKRYKQIMESVRIRQRKLFRFTRYFPFLTFHR